MLRPLYYLAMLALISVTNSYADWTMHSIESFNPEAFCVVSLRDGRFCAVSQMSDGSGAGVKFRYFLPDGTSVDGIAAWHDLVISSTITSWYPAKPAAVYLADTDSIGIVTAWEREERTYTQNYTTSFSSELLTMPLAQIEDGYSSSDRFTVLDSTTHTNNTDDSIVQATSNMVVRAKAYLVNGTQKIAASVAYSTWLEWPGNSWQTSTCSSEIYETKLVYVSYYGAPATLFDTANYVVPSSGADTECISNCQAQCCLNCQLPTRFNGSGTLSTSESATYYTWDPWEEEGLAYYDFTMDVEGTTPTVLLEDPAEVDNDLWSQSSPSSAEDNVVSGGPNLLLASGHTTTGTITWLPYSSGGILYYKYRVNSGSWQSEEIDPDDDPLTHVYGTPYAADTLEDGSLALIYLDSQNLNCAVVPPTFQHSAYIVSVSYVDVTYGPIGISEFNVYNDMGVVALNHLDDEEDEDPTLMLATFKFDDLFKITAPNGGEQWTLGTYQYITWQSNVDDTVKHRLYKGGVFDRWLGAEKANTGSWQFLLPYDLAPDTTYKIVMHTPDYSNNDQSDATFSIVQSPLRLTSPNGGENWSRNSVHSITWTDDDASQRPQVKLQVFKSGTAIGWIGGTLTNNGTYSWTVPSTYAVGTDYKLKIYTPDYGYSDVSNAYFSVN